MAGSIPLSLTQQLDVFGVPLSGGLMYFVQAGTTATPQNAFQDAGLTIPWANPYELPETGRVPLLYFADGYIKVRITDSSGTQVFNQDNIPVTGFSSGGGGGGTIDPTTIFQAGQIISVYGTGVLAGFVRANGRTIGSATSGATERASADTSALFAWLWNQDSSLSVSTGRGATAVADFAANKTIALPDFRGRVLASFDDMGSTFALRLTGTTMTGVGIGAVSVGVDTRTILTAWLPAYTPSGTITNGSITNGAITNGTITNGAITVTNGGITITNGAITVNGAASNNTPTASAALAVGSVAGSYGAASLSASQATTTASQDTTTASQATTTQATTTQATTTQAGSTFAGTAQGGVSTPFSIVQPTILVTTYLKL